MNEGRGDVGWYYLLEIHSRLLRVYILPILPGETSGVPILRLYVGSPVFIRTYKSNFVNKVS